MKRSMMFVCAGLLAFAVGCGKKKDGEKKADDKAGAGDMKPTDPATAGGETKPADPAMQPAGGEAKPAEGGAFDAAALCKKMEELATKEGGKGLEQFNSHLKADCAKEVGEQAAKKGPEASKAFADCVGGAASFSAAMETCKQFD